MKLVSACLLFCLLGTPAFADNGQLPEDLVNMIKMVLKPKPQVSAGPWTPVKLPTPAAPPAPKGSDRPPPSNVPVMPVIPITPDPFAKTAIVFETPSATSGGEAKLGFEGSVYLGLMEDIRDLRSTVANYQAQLKAQESSAEIFSDLYERTRRLLAENAVSRESYEQALMNRDFAVSQVDLLKKAIVAFQTRLDLKRFKAAALKEGHGVDVEKLFDLYKKEWDAQCAGTKAALASSEAHLRLNQWVAQAAEQAYRNGQAESYWEYATRANDLVAARADFAAKQVLDKQCAEEEPTLEDVQRIGH